MMPGCQTVIESSVIHTIKALDHFTALHRCVTAVSFLPIRSKCSWFFTCLRWAFHVRHHSPNALPKSAVIENNLQHYRGRDSRVCFMVCLCKRPSHFDRGCPLSHRAVQNAWRFLVSDTCGIKIVISGLEIRWKTFTIMYQPILTAELNEVSVFK